MRVVINAVLVFSVYLPGIVPALAGPADTVYLNGRIYTAHDAQPWAAAVAVSDGRFVYVGDDAGAKAYLGPTTEKVDLGGRMAMPGIHDAHSHMLWGGLNKLFECRLPLGAALPALLEKLGECAAGQKVTDWLIAGSVWSEQLPNARFHKSYLDEAFPDRAVYVVEGSQHHAFLNSRALELAGITGDTPDPPGGRIIRDTAGQPTGELVEAATVLASKDFKSAPEWQRLEALRWASQLFSRYGITSTQEASANAEMLVALNKVDEEHRLKQRVAAHIIWGSPKFARSSNEVMEQLIARRQDYAGPHVMTDYVKMWIDGSPTPPYFTEGSIDPATGAVDPAHILIPPDLLEPFVIALDRQGIKVKMHVAGAGAAHVALDAVAAARAANPVSTVWHELGHTDLLVPADFPRMAKLKVIGEMSPTIWHLYGPTLGNPPLPAWQFRTLHENGVLMTIGTDWPVTDEPNIFPALQGLLDRGYESLDLETAMKMLTINGALSLGWENETGSIKVGKLANLIVLDRNLFAVPITDIGATVVLKTVFEGETVFEHGPAH